MGLIEMAAKGVVNYVLMRSIRGAAKESIDFAANYRQRYKIVGCNRCGELWTNNPLKCNDCGGQSFTKYYSEYLSKQEDAEEQQSNNRKYRNE